MLVLSTGVFSVLAVLSPKFGGGRSAIDRIHRGWSRSLLAAAGVRVRCRGLEHLKRAGGQVILSNHQSYFDVWALMAALPVSLRFVAKRELAGIPLLGTAMQAAGHVFIDRRRARDAKAALHEAARRMRDEGLTLVLFPEGTRTRDGTLRRFRRGSFGLAQTMRAPVVPVALDGGYRAYPAGAKRVRPGPLVIRLAPPVVPRGTDPREREALMREVRTTIEAMLAEGGEGGRRSDTSGE